MGTMTSKHSSDGVNDEVEQLRKRIDELEKENESLRKHLENVNERDAAAAAAAAASPQGSSKRTPCRPSESPSFEPKKKAARKGSRDNIVPSEGEMITIPGAPSSTSVGKTRRARKRKAPGLSNYRAPVIYSACSFDLDMDGDGTAPSIYAREHYMDDDSAQSTSEVRRRKGTRLPRRTRERLEREKAAKATQVAGKQKRTKHATGRTNEGDSPFSVGDVVYVTQQSGAVDEAEIIDCSPDNEGDFYYHVQYTGVGESLKKTWKKWVLAEDVARSEAEARLRVDLSFAVCDATMDLSSTSSSAVAGKKRTCWSQKWSPDEDQLLSDLVTTAEVSHKGKGCIKWTKVAKNVDGRSGKQCRERWINHLRPDMKKGRWSKDEIDLIVKLQAQKGNRWAEIAGLLPGRSDNDVKNKWHSFMRATNNKERGRRPERPTNT